MISDERVIGYAKWNESEARSLRLHCANSPSMPELAEMHEETASTLYMLLADRAAAIMDADMQAREAGNMEFNARALMAERDRLRGALKELLGMVDWLHSAHAQGKDIPFICTQITPAAAKGWAALKETGHE
jgi:hypothetical protein